MTPTTHEHSSTSETWQDFVGVLDPSDTDNSPPTRYLYPTPLDHSAYREDVVRSFYFIMRHGDWWSLERLARRFSLCRSGFRCGLECCPVCHWIASRQFRKRIISTKRRTLYGHTLQKITVTLRNTGMPSGLALIDYFDSTIELLTAIAERLWSVSLKQSGCGAIRFVECSDTGNVHLHIIYCGPPQDSFSIEREAKAISKRAGLVQVTACDSLQETIDYCGKGMIPAATAFDDEWISGARKVTVVRPWLATCWAIASKSHHLMQPMGAFLNRRRV